MIREIQVGPELFRFESHQQWVNKARSWYATCGYSSRKLVAIDAAGRIVVSGLEFSRAEAEGTFPVSVHPIDPTGEPSEEIAAAGMQTEFKRRGIQ